MYLLFYHTDPRFAYATSTTLNLFELKGKELIKTKLLTTDDVMESFDIDWRGDWVYWANSTGHVMRWSLNTGQTETVPTLKPGTYNGAILCRFSVCVHICMYTEQIYKRNM